MKRFKPYPFFFIAIVFVLISCSDMNDLHDQYLKNGEIIYTGRVDSAEVLPGKNRTMLRYWTSDPKAKKILLYWSSRNDSLLLDIPEKNNKDSVEILIPGLEEGSINFELFTMNENFENRSLAFDLSGNVYGDRYQQTLRNRAVRTTLYSPIIGNMIYWSNSLDSSIGDQILYKNSNGETITKWIALNENKTLIEDAQGEVLYQTAYLPVPNAIDTFYTESRTVDFNSSAGTTGAPRLIDAYGTQQGNQIQVFVFVEGADVDKCSFLLRSVGKEIIGANENFFRSGDFWYLNAGTVQSPDLAILPNHPLNEASERGVFIHTFDTSNWLDGGYKFEFGWHNRPGMGGGYIMFLSEFTFEVKNN